MLLTGTRLASEKKLDRAIAGLRGLVACGVDAVLVLPGDGPERGRLVAIARTAGMEERVRFPGPVPQEEMGDWYRSADLVLSLLDRTNAANPVFEAMACGRTPVVLDAGTTRAVVRDNETGVVLTHDQLPQLGRILAELLGDEERRRRLGSAAATSIRSLVMDLGERLDYEARLVEEAAIRGATTSSITPAAPAGVATGR
jgi:glycosyltransferase involved in cell wall biosynthesis